MDDGAKRLCGVAALVVYLLIVWLQRARTQRLEKHRLGAMVCDDIHLLGNDGVTRRYRSTLGRENGELVVKSFERIEEES